MQEEHTSFSIRKELIQVPLIFLLGCIMAFLFNSYLWKASWQTIKILVPYSGFMWLFFWKGNQYLVEFWNRRLSWLEEPGKRFIYGFLTVLIYTPGILFLLTISYNAVFKVNIDFGSDDVIISIIITFLITFFLFAKNFLSNWRQSALDAERMKKEQMASQYESLKNQVNPHFLFNSLNALTNLVYDDQDKAADFIRKLSKVYRYVLDTQSQEVIKLETELSFVHSYLFLQKTRFDDKLIVNIDLDDHKQLYLPPISLQMLLENAIKHNTIAEEEPLTIDIYVEEDNVLVVKNNLQKKNIPHEEASGMGLSNIKARFEFLSKRPVEIIESETEFIVKLPLLSFKP